MQRQDDIDVTRERSERSEGKKLPQATRERSERMQRQDDIDATRERSEHM
jgi:hypothetical protein